VPLQTISRFGASLIISLLFSLPTFAQGSFTLAQWSDTAPELKPLFVKAIMEQAGVNQVELKQSAAFYQAELDKFADWSRREHYDKYLKASVAQNVATLAVIHCDWHNGVAPFEFAQKYLGSAQLTQLEMQYPEPIARLKTGCTTP